jgi:hypothetical protein
MGTVVDLYEALASAPDDRARARLIAEAFERLDERYPHLADLATQQRLRETELQLVKEIEQLRGEVKTDIEQLRDEIREIELRLQKEIVQVRADLTLQIERSRNTLLMWLIPLMFAQVGAIAALIKLL